MGPTTVEDLEYKYNKMVEAYRNYEIIGGDNFRKYYKTQLDIYRDTCVMVVEKLMQTNHDVLNAIKLWN
jgi:hypothetical protein